IGSPSEATACVLLRQRLREIAGLVHGEHRFNYHAWSSRETELFVGGLETRAHALYWSGETSPEGLEAEVVDLGRGTETEFHAKANRLHGAIALVRHEYPFCDDTIHRRVKYNLARRHGAAGFLIANSIPGE